MKDRLRYIYYKADYFRARLNTKLPKLLRMTKYGFYTTIISFVIASGISVANAKECSNIRGWIGDQECDNVEGSDNLLGGVISAANSIVSGSVEYNDNGTATIKGSLLVGSNNLLVGAWDATDQVSGTRFIADTLEDAGAVNPAVAAPTGYQTFQPVIEVWKIMRNISLGFIMIIGMILAFMILLRVRSGQGYVTIMNALPKIIVGIILIISSYAIAGLMVDIGNLAQKVIVNIFYNHTFVTISDNVSVSNYPRNLYFDGDYNDPAAIERADGHTETYEQDFHIFRLMSKVTQIDYWGDMCPNDSSQVCPVELTDIIRVPTNIGFLDRGLSILEDIPADELLQLILTIIILTNVLKIFFSLLSAFAKMIIFTMFSPIVMLFYPLSSGALTGWIRNFLASSLMFPGAFLMMFLAAIIMGGSSAPWWTTEDMAMGISGHAPDLLTYTISTGSDGTVNFLGKIIGLMIVMMIPHLQPFLNQTLKVAENIMVTGAMQGFKSGFSKVPILGSFVS